MAPSSEAAFAKEVLRLHNDYRAKHGSPPLSLAKELSLYSLAWARQLAKWNRMVHRSDVGRKDGKEYGENLYMRWSTKKLPLNKQSQEWANKLAKEDRGMRHRPGEKLGACLYRLKNHGCDVIPKEVVDSWYKHLSTFNFRNPERNGPSTGSQVIWKESQRLGLGMALTKDGKTWYVVAHYDPPGNITGRYSANVLPRQISRPVAKPARSSKSSSCLIL
ncbi:unnamed protein product [Darwinula stevensoni]|uniref:SCP domain-containing protein n=1 Tax=Darwinula stevensoni TaxID=69355 RepID=A0A7R8XIC3_9CRUS|nr:unnamed protein product [Darwinula stevensoni]CAG0893719.1 unnamed protein product [Darwinula stevensoni]